ncbi:MAG: ATP-binding protein [Clostridia bacterium]|nr:ATP-binding protein [Clostridia bacterium]
MTKSQLINELKLNLDRKRHQAQILADQYVQDLCKDDEFKRLYTNYNQAKIDLIKIKYGGSGVDVLEASNAFDKISKLYQEYISSHKIDVRRMEPSYECHKCNDTGAVNGRLCECLKAELNKRLSEQNKQYKFATFADCSPNISPSLTRIYSIAKEWCNKFPNSHILNMNMMGGTGTGKTFLLECMASDLINKGFNVMFTTAFALNDECRKYHFSLPSKVNEYMDCDILVIDDLGCEPLLKNITVEYLFNIINLRQKRYKPTLISTNLTMEDILNRYDDRIFSRLSNKMIALSISFDGIDMRKRF